MLANNRLLSKLTVGAEATLPSASVVEFQKKSNLILIGFMGSGKSSLGKRLAQELRYDYCDTDERIVSKTGTSIATLFETEGEAHFRELETEVLQELSTSFQKNFVLSTGGGIILSEKNRQFLKSLGTVVWLHASPDVLFERATRQVKRPLLEVEYPRRMFNELLIKRLPLYRETSDVKIDTTQFSYSKTVEELLKNISC